VLLNSGIDELGNPRLRNASKASETAWRKLRPTDPTPVLQAAPPPRSRLGGLLHAFSRSSLLDQQEKAGRRSGPSLGRAPGGDLP
jgi:hypothetical protein